MSFKAFDVEAELLGTRVPELWIVVRNEKQQASQLRKIDRHLVRVKEALASQSRDGVHGKAVCEVVTHKSLKRYVKPSARGKARYILDQDAIRRERRLAGTRLYRTTAIGWTPEGTLDAYWALQQIERNHRELKGPLRLRPCYHRSERRIRAHVMITVLAANCARILEQRSGRTFADLVKDLKLLKAQLVNDGDKVFWQRTELRQEQKEVFTALGVKPPPLTWSRRSTAPTEAG